MNSRVICVILVDLEFAPTAGFAMFLGKSPSMQSILWKLLCGMWYQLSENHRNISKYHEQEWSNYEKKLPNILIFVFLK